MTDVAVVESKLQDHIKASDKEFQSMNLSIKDLRRVVDNIKDNHLEHIQSDISDMKTKIAVNCEKLDRITKFQWVVISAVVGNIVMQVFDKL